MAAHLPALRPVIAWLPPAIGYVFAVGALGVVAKLAIQRGSWPTLVVWAAAAYGAAALVLLLSRQATLRLDTSSLLGLFAGGLAVVGLIFLYLALDRGPAGKVVPVTSAYPALTVFLAIMLLGERATLLQLVGVAVVVVGVILITLSR